jgi:N,N'-diacetylchitobiose transport system permease protein
VLLATVVSAATCAVTILATGCALAVLLTCVHAVPRLALMAAALGAWATPAITGSTVRAFLFDPDHGPVNRVLGPGDRRTGTTAPSHSYTSKSCGACSRL